MDEREKIFCRRDIYHDCGGARRISDMFCRAGFYFYGKIPTRRRKYNDLSIEAIGDRYYH